ncbi:hypothetical protein TNCV_4482901 [Trichonephila clavipes]|nr:hypothetical protein TNCV_4482901 [Trichonephila clavipes]
MREECVHRLLFGGKKNIGEPGKDGEFGDSLFSKRETLCYPNNESWWNLKDYFVVRVPTRKATTLLEKKLETLKRIPTIVSDFWDIHKIDELREL